MKKTTDTLVSTQNESIQLGTEINGEQQYMVKAVITEASQSKLS